MSKRGRPTKEPSADERAKVKELLEEGASVADVAKLVGRSVPNLRKHFRKELFSGKKIAGAKKAASRKISDAMRAKVEKYISCKMPPRHVAYTVGYKTDEEFEAFKADFAVEIEVGKALFRAKVIDRLEEQMIAGVVGATNKLEALTQITDPEQPAASQAPGYVGKKVAAKAAATAAAAAGGKFAPPTPPKLVVNNEAK
jgi:transposase-like protein